MKRYEKAPSKRTKQSTPLLQGLLLLAHTWVACATAPVPAPLPAPHPANSAFSLAPTHETRDPASASASSSSSRTSPPAGLSDAQKFRLFFRDILLVTASNSGTEPVSPDSIRQVLASHPEVLRWALEGKDWHRLFEDADLSQSSSPTGASAPLALPIPKPVADTWLTTLEQTSELERLQALRQVPDSYFEKIAEQAQILVSGYALDESPAVRILASPKSGLGVTDENLAKFLEKVLPRFYKKLNTADKARILAGQLELPPKALEEQQLSALLQSSGPCIQKLFQLIGRDVKNPKLQSAMNALQSEIRPFPGEQALKTIESRYGKSADQLFKTFDQKPLAAASVGQVHLAELSDGQRVVVKVRRPQLRERANREIQELLAAASS
ncbi:MAG: ubiquinone biosynthesis regulatory protein kinase UbiB, partial [Pseudomonadota bacterium]